jgi:hypothetical protein
VFLVAVFVAFIFVVVVILVVDVPLVVGFYLLCVLRRWKLKLISEIKYTLQFIWVQVDV